MTDDDPRWRGIFYSNPDDPRLLVPKRFGIGRTLNYARPMAWVLTFGAPAAVAVLTYLSKH